MYTRGTGRQPDYSKMSLREELEARFAEMEAQEKKKKQEEELRNNLEIGDELITIGGIMGRVVSIKDDDSFILETGPDRTRIHFKKWAISTIVTEKQQPETKDNKKAKKDSVEVKEK